MMQSQKHHLKSIKFVNTQSLLRNMWTKASTTEGPTVDFGYKDVKYEDKEKYVGEVFHKVADNYDLMNDVTSLGIHRLWKQHFVKSIGPMRKRTILDENNEPTDQKEPMKIIDVAGGTGDIAFLILEEAKRQRQYSVNAEVDITVSDINSSMLGVGKDRAQQRGYNDFKWLEANAESIPELENNSFDLYTIAFGIRNVTNRLNALKEAHRILKHGGRFMCLEFSEVKVPIFKDIYDVYSMNIIPAMGKIISNDSESYQYLAESIRKFPNQLEFSAMIREAGFSHVTYENMTGGIWAIHSGYKL